ncbi:ABC transporter permease [Paenibacillus protaetiae]|uniref:ABC transporter permease n=1 Tax=Paenibacillus protaetiae TaxID=2509456 RepID=A0A4P6F502_9BACL|nr:ABC transporter permease [Paenibacillus protaetiae]QAY65468.1 ABC transporter permease [Paenibacillus protaetiae]
MSIRALAIRIWQQFIRDKRTMALLFIAPLLILTLMKLVFDGQSVSPRIGAVGLPEQAISLMQTQGAAITVYSNEEEANAALKDGTLDGYAASGPPGLQIHLEGSDPSESRSLLAFVQNALPGESGSSAAMPAVTYLHGGPQMAPFDYYGPVLIGFFSFFFVFLLAGVSFLRERTTGTLERLLATPIRRSEVVAGYLAGFGVFMILQASLIAWFAVDVLGLYMNGSMAYVLLVNFLLALAALTLGTLLSSFASSEFQIVQFIPLVIVPQVFFSGLFNLDAMNPWLQKLSYIMPLYYGADAMRSIMVRGEGWARIQTDAFVLIGLSLAFVLLNILALRKHRRM